jgi:hypothetical protein
MYGCTGRHERYSHETRWVEVTASRKSTSSRSRSLGPISNLKHAKNVVGGRTGAVIKPANIPPRAGRIEGFA